MERYNRSPWGGKCLWPLFGSHYPTTHLNLSHSRTWPFERFIGLSAVGEKRQEKWCDKTVWRKDTMIGGWFNPPVMRMV